MITGQWVELCTDPYHTNGGFGYTAADRRCHDLIKKTFGVDE